MIQKNLFQTNAQFISNNDLITNMNTQDENGRALL